MPEVEHEAPRIEIMNTSATLLPLLPSLMALSPSDKLQAIEALWDSVHDQADMAEVPAWKLEALEVSRAHHVAEPDAALSWDAVQQRAIRASRQG